MNFTISAEQVGPNREWQGRVSFGGMLVWETESIYPDVNAAMANAQWDFVEGIRYAIRKDQKG